MPSQELLDYIQKETSIGRTRQEITDVLVSAGWPIADVQKGFDALQRPVQSSGPAMSSSHQQETQTQPVSQSQVASLQNSGGEEITDVRKSTFQYFVTHPVNYLFVVLIFGVAYFVGGGHLGLPSLYACIIGCILLYKYLSNKVRGYLMEQFADALGYSFSKNADISTVQGYLFQIGRSRDVHDVISGADGDRPARVFLYSYVTGSGKSSHTDYFTVFENTFDGAVPHILLRKAISFLPTIAPLGEDTVSLEGDFNKYFSLSVEKGFEMEAYEIFTPDFMQELIETSKTLDFEFYQNKLYIYTPKYIDKRAELDAMFALSEKLCTRLEPVIKGMKGDVQAMEQEIHKNSFSVT